jgi:hypothetical protein
MEIRIDVIKYESGKPKRIGQYKGNHKHGQWVSFYESGLVKWIGNYIEGIENGIWKEWYGSGSLKEECFYKESIKQPINFWNEQGGQLLKDGTGYIIEAFGANDNDVYTHHYKNGVFVKEERVQAVSFGKFIPKA